MKETASKGPFKRTCLNIDPQMLSERKIGSDLGEESYQIGLRTRNA
jgi:hypothetical protein